MKMIISFNFMIFLLLFVGVCSNVNAQSVIQGTWETKANEYNLDVGNRYTFNFPPGGTISSLIWGTGIYTSDCSIASAAVHTGLITVENGGTITIEILPGQTSYKGSVSNGVTSYNWGSFSSSFAFVNTKQLQNRLPPDVITGDWVTSASEYNGNIGQQYSFYFPKGIVTTGQVWGTEIYTTDCSIASAAVHAGVLSTQYGGVVTIEILPGQASYKGSTHNGVTSRDWISHSASFKFVIKKTRRYSFQRNY